jgi:hypothetical protein
VKQPPRSRSQVSASSRKRLAEADRPIVLCNECGEPLDARGRCPAGHANLPPMSKAQIAEAKRAKAAAAQKQRPAASQGEESGFFDIDIYNANTEPLPPKPARSKAKRDVAPDDEDEFWNLVE